MSLTDTQIRELCSKMNINLGAICFKDDMPHIECNKAYFINLEDEYDETGKLNSGSHWTTFIIRKYPNGKMSPMYFDAFGMPPPEVVKTTIMKRAKQKCPFNTKDIQSLMGNACGYYCLAWQHFIANANIRSGDLYADTEGFLDYFDDLNVSNDFKKNEWLLKHFFQSNDPKLRKDITIIANTDEIVTDTNDNRQSDIFKNKG